MYLVDKDDNGEEHRVEVNNGLIDAAYNLEKKIKEANNKTINLELTSKEATVLYSILCKIGGSKLKSPRKFADSVGMKLEDAGVKLYDFTSDGSIYYEDQEV